MEMSNIVYFDLKTNQFWVPWYNGGKGGYFDSYALSLLGSFTFKLAYDIAERGLIDQPVIGLTDINGVDTSTLVNPGDSLAFGGETLSLIGDGVYELTAGDGTLDGIASLEFDFEPFFVANEFLSGGTFQSLYIADVGDGAHFNSGAPVELTHIVLNTGDKLLHNGVEVTSTWQLSHTASKHGELRVIEDAHGEIVVQYRDTSTGLHNQVAANLSIERADGTIEELSDNVFFRGIDDSTINGVDTADTSASTLPTMMPVGLIRLMPLDTDGAFLDSDGNLVETRVTPTHVAKAGGGDWNDSSTWESGTVPDAGALVYIPMGASVAATGNVSNGAHIFMVRVDGTLTFDGEAAGAATDTKMVVDTIFSTHMGTLAIDADGMDANDNPVAVGSIDIAITPYDIEADASLPDYYSDGAKIILNEGAIGRYDGTTVEFSNDIRAAVGGKVVVFNDTTGLGDLDVGGKSYKTVELLSQADELAGWEFAVMGTAESQTVWDAYQAGGDPTLESWFEHDGDGAGVLGRYNWDPAQLSLGVIAHGAVEISGQDKTSHVKFDNLNINNVSDIHTLTTESATENWVVGDKILITTAKTGSYDASGNPIAGGQYDANGDPILNDVEATILSVVGNVVTFDVRDENNNLVDVNPFLFELPQSAIDARVMLSVGNLSRNVEIRSTVGDDVRSANYADGTSQEFQYGHFGEADDVNLITQRGHFMVMHSDGAKVSNVAFTDLGRTDKTAMIDDFQVTIKNSSVGKEGLNALDLAAPQMTRVIDGDGEYVQSEAEEIFNMRGRYGVHLHQTGTTSDGEFTTEISGNIVSGSVGWGYVQHGSEGVFIDNIAYNAIGAGFVAETGDETGLWLNNLSVGMIGGYTEGKTGNNTQLSNDVGQLGSGFWLEGRAIALVDNISASSNDAGFHYSASGVDQVPVNVKSLSEYAALIAQYGLSDRITATEGLSDFYANGNDVLDNGFTPIRHFTGNETFGADKGIFITTSNEQGVRKLTDAWSYIDDFTSINAEFGVQTLYTAKYVFDNIRIFSDIEPGGANRADGGFELRASAADNVILNSHVDDSYYHFLDQTSQVGSHIAQFSRQFDPEVSIIGEVAGHYGSAALPEQWIGFDNWTNASGEAVTNPWYNFFNLTIVDGTFGGATDPTLNIRFGSYSNLGVRDENGDIAIWSLPNYEDNSQIRHRELLSQDFDKQDVEIDVIQNSNDMGVVAIWREHMNTSEYYAGALVGPTGEPVIPGTQEWADLETRLESPLAALNSEFAERRYSADYEAKTGNDDIWSGALVEFDKTDSLGKTRFSYESLVLMDDSHGSFGPSNNRSTGYFEDKLAYESPYVGDGVYNSIPSDDAYLGYSLYDNIFDINGDGNYDTVLGDDVYINYNWDGQGAGRNLSDDQSGTNFVDKDAAMADILSRVDNYKRFEFQTVNDRLVLTKEMVDGALEASGYFNISGIEYTNAEGLTELMKFVEVSSLFTDRLDGSIHRKKFVVALDENWGDAGESHEHYAVST